MTPDGRSEWCCCEMSSGKWSLLLVFSCYKCGPREEARLCSSRNYHQNQSPRSTYPLLLLSPKKTACTEICKLLQEVIFGPRVLNQVKSKCLIQVVQKAQESLEPGCQAGERGLSRVSQQGLCSLEKPLEEITRLLNTS